MAVTFLQVINATLKQVRVIQGDAGDLATSTVTSTATGAVATDAFTDSGRQVQIDLAIQLWQQAVHEVYSYGMFAKEVASATLVLATGSIEYALPSDFERFAGDTYEDRVFRGVTNGLLIHEYPGGYARLLRDQPIATDYFGTPNFYTISPVADNIRLDRFPVATETYNALYEKRLALTSTMATETLPFSDTVADAMVPVVSEAYNRIMKKEFDFGNFQSSLVRAVSTLTRTQPRRRYGKR